MRFDTVFLRDCSGRSTLFPIKEEPTGSATSSPSSKRANENEPPRPRNVLPLARAPLSKMPTGSTGPVPSLGTLTHVHQATSAPVAQDLNPTQRNEPVVTPRPPARSAGRYSREDTEESRLSSSGNSFEPSAPSGAVRAVPCDFTPKGVTATTRSPVGSGSRRAPEAGRSQTGTLQARRAEDWCSQTGTLQAHIPNTASDVLAPSTFDPFPKYSTDNVVLFWQTPSFFSRWSPSSFVVDDVPYACTEQFMMVEKARLFKDHRAVELIMPSSDPSTHKRVGRGVRNFDAAAWDRKKKNAVLSGSSAKFTQSPAMKLHLAIIGNKHLAEASSLDPVWSIGLRADDPHAKDPHKWRGKYFLGGALSAVRKANRDSEAGSPYPAFPRRFRSPTGNSGIHKISSAQQSRLGTAVGADQGPPSAFFRAHPPTKARRFW